jgi:tRNA modification GTPase
VMMVFDGSEPLAPADLQVIQAVAESSPATRIAVINKSDLPQQLDEDRLRGALGQTEVVMASATEPLGTDELEERLASLVLSGKASHRPDRPDEATITSVRHLEALKRAQEHVEAAAASISAVVPAAFVAVDLHSALGYLGEITGETATEDLLDEIFGNFCIGK